MTVIYATCDFCGDISLRPDEVVVTDYGQDEHRYEFDCPVCEMPMSFEAAPRVVAVLLAAGVKVVPAIPIPGDIVDMIQQLRDHSYFDVETEFAHQLADVNTLADIGWEMSE